jgi:hypothetical protein
MILSIDLFHEINQRAKERRRDPVRGGILLSVVICLVVAAYYGLSLLQLESLNAAKARCEERWKIVEPQVKKAQDDTVQMRSDLMAVQTLSDRINKRFCWGTVLGRIVRIIPDDIKLTRLTCTAVPATTPCYDVSLVGYVLGSDPRAKAEELRVAAGKGFPVDYNVTSVFQSLEDVTTTTGAKQTNFIIQVDVRKPEPKKKEVKKRAAEPVEEE